MATLADASLRDDERRALERFVRLLEAELGAGLRSVWLYGSRARGERPGPESDVDLFVVTTGGHEDWERVGDLLAEAVEAEGANPVSFIPLVYSAERVAQRREIHSFLIQEVDRDKIVLAGEP